MLDVQICEGGAFLIQGEGLIFWAQNIQNFLVFTVIPKLIYPILGWGPARPHCYRTWLYPLFFFFFNSKFELIGNLLWFLLCYDVFPHYFAIIYTFSLFYLVSSPIYLENRFFFSYCILWHFSNQWIKISCICIHQLCTFPQKRFLKPTGLCGQFCEWIIYTL